VAIPFSSRLDAEPTIVILAYCPYLGAE